MAEKKELNIYQKMQKARVEVMQREIKKTGVNDYSHYTYMELSNFLPVVNEVCLDVGITPIFNFEANKATLTIFDNDNVEISISFSTPVEIPSLKGCSTIQNIGGAQTFARRYLYMMAFEIAENDSVNNNVDPEEEDRKRKEKIMNKPVMNAKVITLNKLVVKAGMNATDFKELTGHNKTAEVTEGEFNEVLKALNERAEAREKAQREVNLKAEQQAKLNKEMEGVF